jgi:hypothetical protein
MPHEAKFALFDLKRQFPKAKSGMFLEKECGTSGDSGDHIGA